MDREFAFNIDFDNKKQKLKVVAAGFESPLNDVVLFSEDEHGRQSETLLSRNDIEQLAIAVGLITQK
jgi:hypothetical protein